MVLHHRLGLNEREHAIAAAEPKESDDEEGIKKF